MVLTGGAILEEGEPADLPRAIAQAGPRAAMLLHRAADAALAGLPIMAPMPPAVAETVAGYVELARKFTPQGAHYLENHRGHLMFVKPEERPFVTAELIRLTTFTATERELKERIAALADAGFTRSHCKSCPARNTPSRIGAASGALSFDAIAPGDGTAMRRRLRRCVTMPSRYGSSPMVRCSGMRNWVMLRQSQPCCTAITAASASIPTITAARRRLPA